MTKVSANLPHEASQSTVQVQVEEEVVNRSTEKAWKF